MRLRACSSAATPWWMSPGTTPTPTRDDPRRRLRRQVRGCYGEHVPPDNPFFTLLPYSAREGDLTLHSDAESMLAATGNAGDFDVSALERARPELVARRLPVFAVGWLVTTAVWGFVLILDARLTVLPATLLFIFQLGVL